MKGKILPDWQNTKKKKKKKKRDRKLRLIQRVAEPGF